MLFVMMKYKKTALKRQKGKKMNTKIFPDLMIPKRLFKNKSDVYKNKNNSDEFHDDLQTWFEMAKLYNRITEDGENANVYMYTCPQTGHIRVAYSLSSDERIIFEDKLLSGLTQKEKDTLYEMANTMGLIKTEPVINNRNIFEKIIPGFKWLYKIIKNNKNQLFKEKL